MIFEVVSSVLHIVITVLVGLVLNSIRGLRQDLRRLNGDLHGE